MSHAPVPTGHIDMREARWPRWLVAAGSLCCMTTEDMRPIFLLSLPRSGSTLVQRVLAAHDQIATTPEPWVLLPHAYALEERGMAAEYTHQMAVRAIREFVDRLPGGVAEYRRALRTFITTLYTGVSPEGTSYFLDKTPRYHFVIEELFATFPDAKFIFLWRDPLAIVASISETWGKGRWNVGRWKADLDGLIDLVEASERHTGRSIAVNYEGLVADPDRAWPPIFEYLGLPFDRSVLTSFSSVKLEGRMGDPTGVRRYEDLSRDPLDKWRTTLDTPVRKRWCREYLVHIGEERLAACGYDLHELLERLDRVPMHLSQVPSDLLRTWYWSWAQRRKRSAFDRMSPRVR